MVNISVMATAAVIMGATTERAGTPQPASPPGPPAAMFRVAVAPIDPKKPVIDFRTPLLSLCAHGNAHGFRLRTNAKAEKREFDRNAMNEHK